MSFEPSMPFEPRIHRPDPSEAAPPTQEAPPEFDDLEAAGFAELAQTLNQQAQGLASSFPANRPGASRRIGHERPAAQHSRWTILARWMGLGAAAAVVLIVATQFAGQSTESPVPHPPTEPALALAPRPAEARSVGFQSADADQMDRLLELDPAVREALFDLEAAGDLRPRVDI